MRTTEEPKEKTIIARITAVENQMLKTLARNGKRTTSSQLRHLIRAEYQRKERNGSFMDVTGTGNPDDSSRVS